MKEYAFGDIEADIEALVYAWQTELLARNEPSIVTDSMAREVIEAIKGLEDGPERNLESARGTGRRVP